MHFITPNQKLISVFSYICISQKPQIMTCSINKYLWTLIFSILISQHIFSQGNSCETSEPFCADPQGQLSFPNVTDVPSTGGMACMLSTPNPAWYYMQIDNSGELIFDIEQWTDTNDNGQWDDNEQGLDVDFVAWGPFNEPTSECGSISEKCYNEQGDIITCPYDNEGIRFYIDNLDHSNIIDCSYSVNSIEKFTITNGTQGQYYLLMITNYSNKKGVIKLKQTNLNNTNAGSTDCSIINTYLPSTINSCEENVELDATTDEADIYRWELDMGNGFESIENTDDLPKITATVSGTYKVTVTNNQGETDSAESVVTIYSRPNTTTQTLYIEKCDVDQNELEVFNITTTSETILNGLNPNEYTISFHTSLTSAENTSNELIANPTQYNSPTNRIYARITNNNAEIQCYSIVTIELIVNEIPKDQAIENQYTCDNGDQDGFANFDFTNVINDIKNEDQSLEVSIYSNLGDYDAGNTPIQDTSNYTNISNPQTLEVIITNTKGCINRAQFNIEVESLPETKTNAPDSLTECDTTESGSDTDGVSTFDLSLALSQICNDSNALLKIYETEVLANEGDHNKAIENIDNYQNITPNQSTVYVRIENKNPISPSLDCFTLVPLTLVVNALPLLNPNTNFDDINICVDNDNFNQTEISTEELTTLINLLDESLNANDYSINYYATSENATNDNSPINTVIINNNTIIYVRVENKLNGCFITQSLNLNIAESLYIETPTNISVCENDPGVNGIATGVATVDLTTKINEITNGNNDIAITFYQTLEAAQAQTNPITDTANYQTSGQTTEKIFATAQDTNSFCTNFEIVDFDINVSELPFTILPENQTLCVDLRSGNVKNTFSIDATPIDTDQDYNYSYQWSTPYGVANTPEVEVNRVGTYSVTINKVKDNGETGCSYTASVIFTGQSAPIFSANAVANASSGNGSYAIQIDENSIEGFNTDSKYEFSINDQPFQSELIFHNVSTGNHTITGRLVDNACSTFSITVSTLIFPKYFTPNNDGYNDNWQVKGVDQNINRNARIYIFDRYGQILAQVSPNSEGWDGTFNGNSVATDNYWFRMEYKQLDTEGNIVAKEAKGHFALKRQAIP